MSSGFTLKLISLHEQGSLGMYVVDKEDGSGVCVVQSLRDDGQAKKFGVKLNDEIYCAPIREDLNHNTNDVNLVGVSTIQMKHLSQSSKRPVRFLVKRQVTAIGEKSNSFMIQNVEKPNHCNTMLPLSKEDIDLALKGMKYPVLPCCKKCNNKTSDAKFHHYLCPKHSDFEGSGAKDKLVILLAGIRDKCEGCRYEFETGKKFKGKHNTKCSRLSRESVKSKNNVSRNRSQVNTKIKATATSKKDQKKEPKAIKVVPVTPIVTNSITPMSTRDQALPLFLTDDPKPSWVQCPNPWGDRAHNDGDFVLMSPECYQLAYETQGSNPKRFISDPFGHRKSQYFKTHKSPNDGYRVLKLTRDKLALRSWGFEFSYHDFGGACLVTEVEPFSPAEAAVRQNCNLPHVLFRQTNQ